MRQIRTAIIAAFALLTALSGSVSAAHCRSESVLVLGEWSDEVGSGNFDPHRLSWEPMLDTDVLSWGISCQEGETDSSRSHPGISIVAAGSNGLTIIAPDRSGWLVRTPVLIDTFRNAPEPPPPRDSERSA
jgi:hypothetical protein